MSDLISRQDAIGAVGLNTWAGSRISQLPTVEAIPIDWLKKWSMEHSLMAAAYTSFMIHEWEKENETN